MNEKILSIIVPTYNMELYLERCLNSLILGNIKDLEVLIINDGSKDNSSNIAHRYAQQYPDIFVVVDKPNGGYGSTINQGIKIAKGKYLKVCDSDDWFDIDAFAHYIDELRSIDADLIYNSYSKEYVNENKSEKIESPFVSKLEDKNIYNIENIKLKRLLCLPEITYRTRILKEINLTLLEKTLYTDLQFVTFPIKAISTIASVNTCLYKYYIGRIDQSISQKSKERNIKQLEKIAGSLVEYRKSNILSHNKSNLVDNLIAEVYSTILCTYLLGFCDNRTLAMHEFKNIRKYLLAEQTSIYKLILQGDLNTNKVLRLYERIPFMSFIFPVLYKIRKKMN